MLKANANMEEIPGVVVGGKDFNPTPPTLPAPCTKVEADIFQKVGQRVSVSCPCPCPVCGHHPKPSRMAL
jgi:hypothetical protein